MVKQLSEYLNIETVWKKAFYHSITDIAHRYPLDVILEILECKHGTKVFIFSCYAEMNKLIKTDTNYDY